MSKKNKRTKRRLERAYEKSKGKYKTPQKRIKLSVGIVKREDILRGNTKNKTKNGIPLQKGSSM